MTSRPVERIAIIGTGVIGASWAALYLARGFDVIATDPGPDAEPKLRDYVRPGRASRSEIRRGSRASRASA
jgi:3-hydroxyacyl-CoA dehydrogenase